jgi:hypothetical protein
MSNTLRYSFLAWLVTLATLQSGCGNGSNDATATSGMAEPTAGRVQFESDAGGATGKGIAYAFSLANAVIKFPSSPVTQGGATRQAIQVDIDSA